MEKEDFDEETKRVVHAMISRAAMKYRVDREDLAQEAWLTAIESRLCFAQNGTGRWGSYLGSAVARSLYHHAVRAMSPVSTMSTRSLGELWDARAVQESEHCASESYTPEQLVTRARALHRLREIVSRLDHGPEGLAALLGVRAHKDIAKCAGITVGMLYVAQMRVRRAVARDYRLRLYVREM